MPTKDTAIEYNCEVCAEVGLLTQLGTGTVMYYTIQLCTISRISIAFLNFMLPGEVSSTFFVDFLLSI